MPRYLIQGLGAEASPAVLNDVIRPGGYGSALTGPKSQTSAWNFVAAAAATAMGLESHSILGTISGATWMASQAEAWVDEKLKEGPVTDLPAKVRESFDWRTLVGLAILGVSTYRATKVTTPWRWV